MKWRQSDVQLFELKEPRLPYSNGISSNTHFLAVANLSSDIRSYSIPSVHRLVPMVIPMVDAPDKFNFLKSILRRIKYRSAIMEFSILYA